MNNQVFLVGILLTVLDLVVSFLGSIGSIGIIDLTDIVSSINKILATFLCFVINIVLPVISINVLTDLFKNIFQNSNETLENNKSIGWAAFIIFFRQILIYIIVYPTVIILDSYTTFLGVSQLFILDELSNTMRIQSLQINVITIFQNSSSEQLAFILAVSIVLLTGHFLLAGNHSTSDQ